MITKEQKRNWIMFKNVIRNLASSQGFYSRLNKIVYELTPRERNEIIKKLPIFDRPVDVCLYLES